MADVDYACILSFCNEVRDQLGRQPVSKLRKGKFGGESCIDCPVARTINYQSRKLVEVGALDVSTEVEVLRRHPECVEEFIFAFDNKNLPEFIGEGWAS